MTFRLSFGISHDACDGQSRRFRLVRFLAWAQESEQRRRFRQVACRSTALRTAFVVAPGTRWWRSGRAEVDSVRVASVGALPSEECTRLRGLGAAGHPSHVCPQIFRPRGAFDPLAGVARICGPSSSLKFPT